MNFTVIWVPAAEQELAAIWLNSSSRSVLTQAAHRIDQRLAVAPLTEGEARPGGRRILFEPPLGALYRVDEPNAMVHVLHVWQFRLRGQQP